MEPSDSKWSPLNEPTLVYPVALYMAKRATSQAKQLAAVVQSRVHGPLWRRVLMHASLSELGFTLTPAATDEPIDEKDVIACLWFTEKYLSEEPKAKHWTRFAGIRDTITFRESEDVPRVLDVVDLALMYEALTIQLRSPDPVLLLKSYPLEPEVRQAAESLFTGENYVHAVQNAALKLKEVIQNHAGLTEEDETALIDRALQLPNPILGFNDQLQTKTGMNEQKGLHSIAKGIFDAFRNPPSHLLSDRTLLSMDPREALDKLVIISYLIKRVKRSNKRR